MSYNDAANYGAVHSEWLKKLDFYKTEIGILEKRLEEVNAKNTSLDARAGVEHFQNQFIVQRNNIDELKHIVNEHSHNAFEVAKEHAGKVNDHITDEHLKLEDDINQFEKIVNELRQEFNVYLTKWM